MVKTIAGLLFFALCSQPSWAQTQLAPITMGFYLPSIRDANMSDIRVSLQAWSEELAKPVGLEIVTSTYSDMKVLRAVLSRSELDVVNASGMELAELFSPDELQGGYTSRTRSIEQGLALVVSKSSGFRQVADLRGKRVARLSNDRLAEVFLETQCLKFAAVDCRSFMTLHEEKRDIQSVYSVFFGRADAALVALATLRTAADLNPQIAERLVVILDWKTKGMNFAMLTRRADPDIRNIVLNSAKEVMKTSRGRQLLEMFRVDEIEAADPGDLKPYWDLLKEYNDLRAPRTAKKK